MNNSFTAIYVHERIGGSTPAKGERAKERRVATYLTNTMSLASHGDYVAILHNQDLFSVVAVDFMNVNTEKICFKLNMYESDQLTNCSSVEIKLTLDTLVVLIYENTEMNVFFFSLPIIKSVFEGTSTEYPNMYGCSYVGLNNKDEVETAVNDKYFIFMKKHEKSEYHLSIKQRLAKRLSCIERTKIIESPSDDTKSKDALFSLHLEEGNSSNLIVRFSNSFFIINLEGVHIVWKSPALDGVIIPGLWLGNIFYLLQIVNIVLRPGYFATTGGRGVVSMIDPGASDPLISGTKIWDALQA